MELGVQKFCCCWENPDPVIWSRMAVVNILLDVEVLVSEWFEFVSELLLPDGESIQFVDDLLLLLLLLSEELWAEKKNVDLNWYKSTANKINVYLVIKVWKLNKFKNLSQRH